MSTHKYIERICVAVMICAVIVTLLFMNGAKLGLTAIVDEDAESYTGTEYFTANDQNAEWDTAGATVITLNGDTAKISGSGAYVLDGLVYITGGGYYVLSGELTDGSVVVDAYDSSKVWLLFDGVGITCPDDAGLRIDQADKVFLTLAEGSENSITSGAEYPDEALEDGTDGAIFAHDDLTINGSGSLTVTAEYRHGIAANDELVITGGTISVTAPADAIHVNDSCRIMEAALTLEAGDDGLVVAEEDGSFYMESGSVTITSADDGIHTAGDVTIEGGMITINAGDDGIHSDTDITVNGGTIDIPECYEGLEAITITVNDGVITVYPQDDGFNANGGSADMFGMGMMGGMRGSNNESTQNETVSTETETAGTETCIAITGGTITIINGNGRDADGLDSNGSIYISGGDIRVSLNGNGSNSAIDCGSESGGICVITGGTIIACGGSSMAESFDSSSEQPSIFYNSSTLTEAGTLLTLTDADGNDLLSYEVPCSFNSVSISCPEMTEGETYTLTVGSETQEVTLDSAVTRFGTSAGMGGMGMMGGFGDRGGSTAGNANANTDGQTETDGSRIRWNDEDTAGTGTEDGTENNQAGGTFSGHPQGSEPALHDDSLEELEDGEEAVVTAKTLAEFDSPTWLWMGASVAVIIAGLAVAILFKRRS